jgi:hypothetical protein
MEQDSPVFSEIRAMNFKSWSHVTPYDPNSEPNGGSDLHYTPGVPVSMVTGLFGTNSSGKTSLLQIILLLKQTVESSDRTIPIDLGDERSLVRLGTFSDVLYEHAAAAELRLGVSWNTPEPVQVADPETENQSLFDADHFEFDTKLVQRRNAISVESFRYQAGETGETHVEFSRQSLAKDEYRLEATVKGNSGYLKRALGRKWPLPPPIKCYGFPDQVSAYFQNAGFVGDIELAFEQQMRRTFYLGPLRERDYTWTGARPRDVGYAGGGAVPALLAAQLGGKKSNYRKRSANNRRSKLITMEEHVAEWLRELGLVHSFRVAPLQPGVNIYRVYVQRSESSPEVLLTDIGFGVSQVLPVLVLLAYVPEGSTVVLEQPEIHLHPFVQAGLADVILEAALVRNVQVIVESHSEHLLRRIQLRVAEQKLATGTPVTSDSVSLWFIDQLGASSRANDLDLNLFGEIVNWPKDFFGDPFGETARINIATLRHRQRSDRKVRKGDQE